MKNNIYMDYAATTFVKEQVLQAMNPYFTEYYANPSAIYSYANHSKMAIDESREQVAKVINCKREEIYFTAGGSEADNFAIKGIAMANKHKGNHIITSKVEHHAVLHACEYLEAEGFEVTYLSVDAEGFIDLKELEQAIREDTILVTLMFANNEIGTIQPVKQIGAICKAKGVIFHCDAVQAIGAIEVDVNKLNIDALSMSAHKFYGPKGIGALYLKKGIKIHNLVHGGGQERGKRAGTENVPAIVGMAKAIELSHSNLLQEASRLSILRDKLIYGLLQIEHSKLNGSLGDNRLCGNVNISFEDVEGDILLMNLDAAGIYASAGSACSAGALEASHVIKAIGIDNKYAKGTVRFSLGASTQYQHIEYVIESTKKIVDNFRGLSKKLK